LVSNDEREIRRVIERWMSATRAGDTATVLGLMADDVIFMVPGREPFGKPEFAAASEAMTKMRVDGRADVREVKVLDDWAYARNYLEVSIAREGAPLVRRAGYTLTIFRKGADGRWRLARDANLVTDT
jgi:uncharacterized protein (TIGR02246 family)